MCQLLSKVTVTSCSSSAGILHGCLQQDGAPSHTARNTPTYLRRENVTFIEPHMWPPNSSDLNPVDCAAWDVLQQMVCQSSLSEANCWSVSLLAPLTVRVLRACRTRFGCQVFDDVFCRCSAIGQRRRRLE